MHKIKMTKERYNEIMEMADITIGHWQEVVTGTRKYKLTTDCPACKKYRYNTRCEGCPIFERTGSKYCQATPVVEFNELYLMHNSLIWLDKSGYQQGDNYDLAIELKAAAQDCLDFLINLRNAIVLERGVEIIKENNKAAYRHDLAHDFTVPLSEDII